MKCAQFISSHKEILWYTLAFTTVNCDINIHYTRVFTTVHLFTMINNLYNNKVYPYYNVLQFTLVNTKMKSLLPK